MRLFCKFSDVCTSFNIGDDDNEGWLEYGTGKFFIHYIGYDTEQLSLDYESKSSHYEGTNDELLEQLALQGVTPPDNTDIFLNYSNEVSLIATLKVQLLGSDFISALLAYAKKIDDPEFSTVIVKKVEHIRKKTNFEYSKVESPFEYPSIQRKA